jgi:hypothetical protein
MDFINYTRQPRNCVNATTVRQYCFTNNYHTINDGQQAFRYATMHGQIKLAKLVLEMNRSVNISSGNEHAFRHACKGGHVKMAKWLLRKKPNIEMTSLNNWAMHSVIERGHIGLFSWLQETLPMRLTESNWMEIHRLMPHQRYERQQLLLQPWRLPPRIYRRIIFDEYIPIVPVENDLGGSENDNNYMMMLMEDVPILSEVDIIPNPKFRICNTVEKQNLIKECETCAVCYEKESDIITTCEHMYCKKCILKWTRKHDTCPMCRTQLDHDTGLNKIV